MDLFLTSSQHTLSNTFSCTISTLARRKTTSLHQKTCLSLSTTFGQFTAHIVKLSSTQNYFSPFVWFYIWVTCLHFTSLDWPNSQVIINWLWEKLDSLFLLPWLLCILWSQLSISNTTDWSTGKTINKSQFWKSIHGIPPWILCTIGSFSDIKDTQTIIWMLTKLILPSKWMKKCHNTHLAFHKQLLPVGFHPSGTK